MASSVIHYVKQSNVRVHPIPQWKNLLVFTPAQRRLHWLNLNAWVIFELCDGRSEQELRAAYLEMVTPRLSSDEAEGHLRSGLALLQTIGAVKQEHKKGDSDALLAQEPGPAV